MRHELDPHNPNVRNIPEHRLLASCLDQFLDTLQMLFFSYEEFAIDKATLQRRLMSLVVVPANRRLRRLSKGLSVLQINPDHNIRQYVSIHYHVKGRADASLLDVSLYPLSARMRSDEYQAMAMSGELTGSRRSIAEANPALTTRKHRKPRKTRAKRQKKALHECAGL